MSEAHGLEVRAVSKTYGATHALRDVSFSVDGGHLHALVGENGSGKSTLVKILAGVVHGDGGSVVIDGAEVQAKSNTPETARTHGLHFVHQDPGLFGELTVADNLFLGAEFPTGALGSISRRTQRRVAREILERFDLGGISPDDRVAGLSSGMRTMLAVARALQDQTDLTRGILVLDEPTASLPEKEAQHLLQSLRELAAQGKTILYVTHRLDEVMENADSFTAFRDGRHVTSESSEGLTRGKLIEHIVGRSLADLQHSRADVDRVTCPVLEVDSLVTDRLTDVTFTVYAGEVLGIAGMLGSGRSSLLRTMFGGWPARSGSVRVDGVVADLSNSTTAMRSGFGYVPEDRVSEGIFPDQSVRFNLTAATMRDFQEGWKVSRAQENREAKRLIAQLGVKCQSPEQGIASLSGGNQQKAIIGRWLRKEPRVLMLDEPTQGVDVGARADIYPLIREAARKGAAVIVASSDFEELAAVCDRVLVINRGRITHERVGDDINVTDLLELAHQTANSPVPDGADAF